MRDTRTPVYVGIGAVLLNIALGWTLLHLGMGLGGLALAFSIANIIEAAALGRDFWGALGRMALATLAFGATLLAALRVSEGALPFLRAGDLYRWPADFLALAGWLA